MTTLIVAHPAFGRHETPEGHPEQRARYAAVSRALEAARFADALRLEAPRADWAAVERAHTEAHVARVRSAADAVADRAASDPDGTMGALDADTFMGPSSLDAALRAAGGATAAVDAVCAGRARNAFVAARPPGHHAEPERAMGFCFFNSAAIAALHARAAHGLTRVAVVDFDVHHGNGTEAAFWDDENAFFASSHEWPQYPGTGRAEDRGAFETIANASLATGTGREAFRRAWGETLLPALDAFGPQFIVISAGFDAHAADPLGGLRLTEDDFAWATREILGVADACCDGRVVSLLEGGYDLSALEACVGAHVGALGGT